MICDCHRYLYESFNWFNKHGYVVTKIDGNYVPLHRIINDTPSGYETDHINGDISDNRCSNLRTVTFSENQMNRGAQTNNGSGYKGVSWRRDKNKYQARVEKDKQKIHLGYFDDVEEAALAYDCGVIQLFGDIAYTNIL